jgi:hypothetical protein
MARRPSPFRLTDIARAVKGAKVGGMDVGRIEITTDKIIVFAADAAPEPTTAFDSWKVKRDARSA